MPYPLIYLGTPEFAVTPLKMLAKNPLYQIKAVITQPDKPSGRGHKLVAGPVKLLAEELGLKVLQPKTLKTLKYCSKTESLIGSDLAEELNSLGPIKAAMVVAYGKIVPAALFDWPEFGSINIHPSLLPRWRGAAPIHRALFTGDLETGTCLMQLDQDLDTGPIYSQKSIEILSDDDLKSLHDRLVNLSTQLLEQSLPEILEGKLLATSQAETGLCYAEKWSKEDCQMNWKESAEICDRRIRTCFPRPGAWTTLGEKTIKIFKAKPVKNQNYLQKTVGSIVELNKEELIVQCGENSFLALESIQFPGKKSLAVRDIINGGLLTSQQIFR